jgi:hypothetical protein
MKHNGDVKISEKAHKKAVEAVEISYPIPANGRYAKSINSCGGMRYKNARSR